MELNEKLKFLRKKHGLSQLQVSEKILVSRQAVSGWESGSSRPSIENLQSLSKLYSIPLEILLDDKENVEYKADVQQGIDPKEQDINEEAAEKKAFEIPELRRKSRQKYIVLGVGVLITVLMLMFIHMRGQANQVQEFEFKEMGSDSWNIADEEEFTLHWE